MNNPNVSIANLTIAELKILIKECLREFKEEVNTLECQKHYEALWIEKKEASPFS